VEQELAEGVQRLKVLIARKGLLGFPVGGLEDSAGILDSRQQLKFGLIGFDLMGEWNVLYWAG
jgi:hypothetical protein